MQQWQKNRKVGRVSLVRALLSAGVSVSIALVVLFYSGYRVSSSNSLADEDGMVANARPHDRIMGQKQGLAIPAEHRNASGAQVALDTLVDPVTGANTITVKAPELSGRNFRGHSSGGVDEVIHTNGTLDGSGYGPAYYGGQSTAIGAWWQGCEGTPMTSGRYDCERRFNYGTFTLTAPAELNAVHVWIGGFNNWGLPGEPYLKIEIYQGDPTGSATSSALLATSNQVVVGHSYPTGAERTFTFASPVTLSGGTPYTIRLYLPSGIRGDLGSSEAYALYGVTLTPPFAQFSQQGPKLVGTGALGNASQGHSVSVSGDGNTAIVGGPADNSNAGAAWVFTKSGGVWTQQGPKLVGSGAVGSAQQGFSVSLSADGNTAIVGGYADNNLAGAAWVWTRSGGVWTQQGMKVVGTGAVGNATQGYSISLSADGNTAIVGGPADNSNAGAAWVFTASTPTPTPTSTNGQIAFTSLRPSDSEIYVMNADGTNQVNVSNSSGHDSEPSFSPDGKRIAFRSQRDGNFEIYVMNANGTGQINLTNNSSTDVNPDFSPDNTKIAFSSSRDGHSQIYVMDADGSNPINLSNNSFSDYRSEFSPDGSKIAFTSDRNGNQDIYVMNVDGSNPIRLTTNPGGDSDPTFSPDGQKIAFLSARSGQNGVYIMNADGTNQIYISNDPSTTYEPTFSPDGSKIAFGTFRTGNPEIFLMNPDGTDLVNITNSPGADLQPSWAQASVTPITPAVFSIVPSTPASSPSDQDAFISGTNFKPNLTVEVSAPGGGVTTLSGGQIQNVTETSFILRATLNAPGNWSIKVKNPDNQESAAFQFTVASGGSNPFITSISPNAPTANGADQDVIVTGGNFQNGLKVNATFPGGGIATLQGTGQIQNVTPNSFIIRTALNTEGAWKIRIINPDNSQSPQFIFNVQLSGPPPSGLPTSVLSPVIGPLRVTTENLGISDSKWEFDQHKSGYHTATGGIARSNDTFGWDINLYAPTSANADAGKAVFAVAAGQVISYVGTPPGGGPGAVLIAHPNAQNPVWFSGYLHMNNVRVTLNQTVDPSTLIGEIGRAGADNDHLHFVVYSGRNTRGNLQSFNAVINERSSTAPNPPTINSINPSGLNQGDEPQAITINGANFASDSIVEVQTPNGQSLTVTPQTISTSTTITANVKFVFPNTYKFTIINRATGARSTGNCPQSCINVASAPLRTPVILIPGIMGSKIAKRIDPFLLDPFFVELFPSAPALLKGDFFHRMLKDDVVNTYVHINQRRVVATHILRSYLSDYYGNLIDWLTRDVGYTPYDVKDPNQRTLSGCDTTQTGADLFLFAYDWRNSNAISAQDLREFVRCIRKIRDPNSQDQNFKVDIIAHSMGGLVARRYILDGDHHVDRMVTLGTPWLGAPKVIPALEDGTFEGVNKLISKSALKEIAPFIKGAHELIPSKAFTDDLTTDERGSYPFGEDGWDDFDTSLQARIQQYDFNTLKAAMNYRYANNPGTTTELFHGQPGQDDWRANHTGVSYYQFVGVASGTIGTLISKQTFWRGKYLEIVEAPIGDGTVPNVSATRQGRQDYRGTEIQREKFFAVDHLGLASDRNVFPAINCVINNPDPNSCLDQLPLSLGYAKTRIGAARSVSESTMNQPNYNLRVIGSSSVIISDSFGNTTDPLSTSLDEGVRTVTTNVTGANYLSVFFPLDQNYNAVLKAPSTPVSITLTKSDGQTITQAIRYVDIALPTNVLAILEVAPQGVSTLKYDSDSNGTFDITVNPTITVTGSQAQDIEPPSLTVNERTVQGGTSQIEIAATDAGAGVKTIMYSVNGTDYHVYTGPLTLNASQTPFVYAFADDNVMNRSGLLTYQLTPSVVSIDSIGTLAGHTSGGQQIILTGAFPGLSTVTMGGVAASWVYTNGGGDTSSITITTPPHAVGAIEIDLSPVSGSGYLKPNAFAYLPTVFTDDTLIAGVTTAKAQHIIELRQAVEALRAVAGLSSAVWTDATLVPSITTIRTVHIQELRTYLEEAALQLGYPIQPYTDPSLTNSFFVKRVHIEELRQRIRAIAG